VSLAAPRARDRVGPGVRFVTRLEIAWEHTRRDPRFPVACAVLAVVPGLGHVASGRAHRGLYVFLTVGGLVTLAASCIDLLPGQALFGIAMAAHALSILDCTPWRAQRSTVLRTVALTLIQAAVIPVYWPLLLVLSEAYIRPILYYAGEPSPLFGIVSRVVLMSAPVLAALLLVRRKIPLAVGHGG
jgi:hypothetical protein